MKLPQITSKPGFELVFALSIAAIFVIPQMTMAQSQKNTEIIITNGDTVINGKNIKTLTPDERAQALTDMNKLKGLRGGQQRKIVIERDMKGAPGQPPMIANDGMGHQYGDYIGGEHIERPMHLKKMTTDTNVRTFQFRIEEDGKTPPPPPIVMDDRRPTVQYFRRDGNGMGVLSRLKAIRSNRNSQRFSYSNTDVNGATTNINYSVTEPMAEETAAGEKGLLAISNIKLVPDFTNGKTTLSFDLPAKGVTQVELINSEDKAVWSEKASIGSFAKSFAMPLNGMYTLKVKQGSKSVIKKIMKEE